MSFNEQAAVDAVTTIMHDVLEKQRYCKGDALANRKIGAMFVVNGKQNLGKARGKIMTSQESVLSAVGATHWTPNVFRYGKYRKLNQHAKVLTGHEEGNLKAITCFVVDVDYPAGEKPEYGWEIDCFDVQLLQRVMSPNLVLGTPHGYQAYYILDEPLWIKRNDQGKLPALISAKMVSSAIRNAVAAKNDHTDVGANHFGFFRMPSADNILEMDEDTYASFAELQEWSMTLQKTAKHENSDEPEGPRDQIHTAWFKALAAADVDAMKQGGLARNNTLFTLLLAMYSSKQPFSTASKFADEWNSRQTDPLPKRELRSTLASAYSGEYQGAELSFVKELCAQYAPGVTIHGTGHAWKHIKRSREERQHSHLDEWGVDLVHLAEASTDRVNGHARFGVEQLERDLKIGRRSLMRLLDKMQASGVFSVQRKRGRNGCILVATSRMMEEYVRTEKRLNAQERREMLKVKEQHEAEEAPFMVEQLNLFYTLKPVESPPNQRC